MGRLRDYETGADWLIEALQKWDTRRARSVPELVKHLKRCIEPDTAAGAADLNDGVRRLLESLLFTQQAPEPLRPSGKKRLLCRELVGRHAHLARRVETKGGVVIPKGMRVYIQQTYRGRFYVRGVDVNGSDLRDGQGRALQCSGVERNALLMEE